MESFDIRSLTASIVLYNSLHYYLSPYCNVLVFICFFTGLAFQNQKIIKMGVSVIPVYKICALGIVAMAHITDRETFGTSDLVVGG